MAKRIVITGCTKGIGRALLEHFAQEHEVAGCGRSISELEVLKLQLPNAKLKQLDLSSSLELQSWFGELKNDWDWIDLLVANAGTMPSPAKLWEIPCEDWQKNLAGERFKYLPSPPSLSATAEAGVHRSSHFFTLWPDRCLWDVLLQRNQMGN